MFETSDAEHSHLLPVCLFLDIRGICYSLCLITLCHILTCSDTVHLSFWCSFCAFVPPMFGCLQYVIIFSHLLRLCRKLRPTLLDHLTLWMRRQIFLKTKCQSNCFSYYSDLNSNRSILLLLCYYVLSFYCSMARSASYCMRYIAEVQTKNAQYLFKYIFIIFKIFHFFLFYLEVYRIWGLSRAGEERSAEPCAATWGTDQTDGDQDQELCWPE